jgi:putative membrane protein
MAMAFGYGMHYGFGLSFLNFIGAVLFFAFLVWAFKMVFRGMRYTSGQRGWMAAACGPGKFAHHDEAFEAARQRLAQGEIDAEAYEKIKSGLKTEAGSSWGSWGQDRALQLARLRFAKGEISLEDFEAVKKTLLS